MDAKKKKIIIWSVAVLIVTIVLCVSIFDIKDDIDTPMNNGTEKYIYNFGDAINFEEENGIEEEPTYSTDYDSLGDLSQYSDESAYIYYYDDKARIESYNGSIIVSASWMNEGNAKKINQPDFGIIQKFVLEKNSITVSYLDVELKQIENYINDLAGLGFNNIILNNKNKKKDTYYYTASKSDGTTVNLSYKEGELYIEVY